jgi:haloalkane dehalogenase
MDLLQLDSVAVVGHDSGGMIARHALAGDERLSAMGLIDTEQSQGMSLRFKMFLANRHVPGFGAVLRWLAGKPALRRNGFVLGDAFVDRSLLDGEFDEFFLRPLATDPAYRAAAMKCSRASRCAM